jgi:hypothetical protein
MRALFGLVTSRGVMTPIIGDICYLSVPGGYGVRPLGTSRLPPSGCRGRQAPVVRSAKAVSMSWRVTAGPGITAVPLQASPFTKIAPPDRFEAGKVQTLDLVEDLVEQSVGAVFEGVQQGLAIRVAAVQRADTDPGLGGDVRERDMAALPQHQGDL